LCASAIAQIRTIPVNALMTASFIPSLPISLHGGQRIERRWPSLSAPLPAHPPQGLPRHAAVAKIGSAQVAPFWYQVCLKSSLSLCLSPDGQSGPQLLGVKPPQLNRQNTAEDAQSTAKVLTATPEQFANRKQLQLKSRFSGHLRISDPKARKKPMQYPSSTKDSFSRQQVSSTLTTNWTASHHHIFLPACARSLHPEPAVRVTAAPARSGMAVPWTAQRCAGPGTARPFRPSACRVGCAAAAPPAQRRPAQAARRTPCRHPIHRLRYLLFVVFVCATSFFSLPSPSCRALGIIGSARPIKPRAQRGLRSCDSAR
jgi:hypothetical protein